MSQTIPDRKPYIVQILKLIASEEEQLAYERSVPYVDITNELVCMWFDDLYCPENAHFRSCFTTDELAALTEFNGFYNEQKRRLPESRGTICTWLANPAWREIMKRAQETLPRVT